MAALFLGEMPFYRKNREYILRPSLQALYTIERKTGQTIATLLVAPLPPTLIRLILEEGIKAGQQIMPRLSHRICERSRETAQEFLRRGLGAFQEEASIPWRKLYRLVTGSWSRSEAEFWQMTLPCLLLTMEGYLGAEGIDDAEWAAPMSQRELAELMRQFPDTLQ